MKKCWLIRARSVQHLGYDVTTRTSSLDALATFQEQPDFFDAVITDQTMPEINGGDLAREMLRIRPDLPIILCTGYSSIIDEEQAKVEGIKGFAMKPFAKAEIATLLRKVLDAQE
jgi:CheY-like chemotaxis protein